MLTSMLESLMNRGVPRSVRAQQLCAELAGRRCAVEAPAVARVVFESTGAALRIRRGEEPADAAIVGGALSLLIVGGSISREPLVRGAVEVRGDPEIAEKFQQLLRLLSPDLEEELARAVGDVPAHRLARLARGAAGWSGRAALTLWRDLGEYTSHERRDLVPRPEGETFLHGVDALREDVDRLAARLEQLEHRVHGP